MPFPGEMPSSSQTPPGRCRPLAMVDYSVLGGACAIATAATAPLALSLGPTELIALTVGTGLIGVLVRMTFVDGKLSADYSCTGGSRHWRRRI
eukprot:5219058-Prymnesium_polylepis.1